MLQHCKLGTRNGTWPVKKSLKHSVFLKVGDPVAKQAYPMVTIEKLS